MNNVLFYIIFIQPYITYGGATTMTILGLGFIVTLLISFVIVLLNCDLDKKK